MINGIIQQYLGDNACTDVISNKLRETCPSLYSLDDAKCSKANELLLSLGGIATAPERSALLFDALNVRLLLYSLLAQNIHKI